MSGLESCGTGFLVPVVPAPPHLAPLLIHKMPPKSNLQTRRITRLQTSSSSSSNVPLPSDSTKSTRQARRRARANSPPVQSININIIPPSTTNIIPMDTSTDQLVQNIPIKSPAKSDHSRTNTKHNCRDCLHSCGCAGIQLPQVKNGSTKHIRGRHELNGNQHRNCNSECSIIKNNIIALKDLKYGVRSTVVRSYEKEERKKEVGKAAPLSSTQPHLAPLSAIQPHLAPLSPSEPQPHSAPITSKEKTKTLQDANEFIYRDVTSEEFYRLLRVPATGACFYWCMACAMSPALAESMMMANDAWARNTRKDIQLRSQPYEIQEEGKTVKKRRAYSNSITAGVVNSTMYLEMMHWKLAILQESIKNLPAGFRLEEEDIIENKAGKVLRKLELKTDDDKISHYMQDSIWNDHAFIFTAANICSRQIIIYEVENKGSIEGFEPLRGTICPFRWPGSYIGQAFFKPQFDISRYVPNRFTFSPAKLGPIRLLYTGKHYDLLLPESGLAGSTIDDLVQKVAAIIINSTTSSQSVAVPAGGSKESAMDLSTQP
jgi:hypothetical protein